MVFKVLLDDLLHRTIEDLIPGHIVLDCSKKFDKLNGLD